MSGLTTYVTALKFVKFRPTENENENATELLFAGIGHQMHVFSLIAEKPLAFADVLPPGVRIHGFSETNGQKILVHGGRNVAIANIKLDKSSVIRVSIEEVKEFDDWVFGANWWSFAGLECIAIVGGHSKVWLCDHTTLRTLCFVQGEETELTWSSTLFESHDSNTLRVAGGTSFGDVLVWNALCRTNEQDMAVLEQTQAAQPRRRTMAKRPRAHRMKAHDGPIMRIRISKDTRHMATASVDRSVRVWKASNECCCMCTDGCYAPLFAHYGHLGRIWDVCFSHGAGVISTAEDRTSRLWSPEVEGKCEAIYYGHAGRNVWSVDVTPAANGFRIATGGEDGSIKLRRIETVDNPDANGQHVTRNGYTGRINGCTKGFFTLPDNYANPRKTGGANDESARSLLFRRDGDLIVTTDFGRILSCRVCVDNMSSDKEVADENIEWTELYRDERGIAYTPCSVGIHRSCIFAGRTDGHVTILRSRDNDKGMELAAHIDVFGGAGDMVMSLFIQESNEGCVLFVGNAKGELFAWQLDLEKIEPIRSHLQGIYRMERLVKSAVTTCTQLLPDANMLIVGDRGGRIILYPWSQSDADSKLSNGHEQRLNGRCDVVHPIHISRIHTDRVSMLRHIPDNTDKTKVKVISAGFDGNINHLHMNTSPLSISVSRTDKCLERVDTLEGMFLPSESTSDNDMIISGFRGAEMILCDLQNRSEITRLDVGNWRRAHASHLSVTRRQGECDISGNICWWRAGTLHVCHFSRRDTSTSIASRGTLFHGQRANAVALVSDGRDNIEVMTVGEDCCVLVCALKDGVWSCTKRLERHLSGVSCIDCVDDVCVTGGGCDEMIVWKRVNGWWGYVCDVRIGMRLGEWWEGCENAQQRVLCVAIEGGERANPKEGSVFVGRSDGSLVHASFSSEHVSVDIVARCEGAVLCIWCSDAYVACGDSRGWVYAWHVQKDGMDRLGKWHIHDGGVNGLAGMCTNKQVSIVSGGDDERVCLLQTSHVSMGVAEQRVWRSDVGAHTAAVTDVSMVQGAPEGTLFVSGGADQRLCVWKIEGGLHLVRRSVTSVADVGGICAWVSGGLLGAVVCGAGMQAVRMEI